MQAVVVRRADSGYVRHGMNLPLFAAVPGAGRQPRRPESRMGPCSGDPTHFFGRHLTKLTTTTHRAGSGLLRETARRDPHASSLLAGEGWAEADCRAHRRPRMRERPMLTTRPPEPGDESWTATLVQPLEGDAGSLRPSSEPTPFNRCDRDRAHNTGRHLQSASQRLPAKRAHLRALSGARPCWAAR